MFKFLRGLFSGGADAHVEAQVVSAVNEGLDLRAAIAAHENWKIRLDAYLGGQSNEDLRAEVICFDDRCDLGKWIYSTGHARLGALPGFTALVGNHKQFHYAASNVVALSKVGKKAEAQAMLDGPYKQASAHVVGALRDLMAMVEKTHRKG